MENREYVAAVDLGTTKVVIAIGRKAEKNKVEIVALKEIPSQGVIKGDLKNIEQSAKSLREVKSRIENELGITIKEVHVGVSGQHIKCSRATGYVFVQNSDKEVSEVTEADVKRLKDDMRNTSIPIGQTIITVLPQAYTLDDETDISEPVGMEGKRLEAKFNIIVGEDAAIERIRRCFNRVGLTVSGIVLQPLASSEAVLSEDEKELGVAVVDIGGGTTDLCIYHDKVIRHIAVIPIGGNIINKDIRAYGILERHVEKLKISFGEAIAEKAPAEKYINIPSVSGQAPKEIAVRALAGIIEARMHDIIDYVMLEIEKCGYKGKLGAGIVLTGGGATLKNLNTLFKAQLGIEVRVASPTMSLTPESAELVANPKYSTITGLLIDAIKNGRYTEVTKKEVVPAQEQPQEQSPVAPAFMPPPVGQSYDNQHVTSQSAQPDYQPDSYLEYEQIQNQDDDPNNPQHEYNDEGEITTTTKGRGVIGRFKRMFGSMFEEVDDEDNF